MSKFFIHLGLHKTGTTFLQSEVFPKYENVQYISRPFTQYNHEFNRLQYADDTLFDSGAFKETLDYFDQRKILISDENLSGKIYGYSYINRSMIAHRLEKALQGRETEIILVIRGQKSMMGSLYNHWVKSYLKGDRAIEEFFWYPEHNFLPQDLREIGNGDERMSLNYLYFNTNRYFIHLDSLKFYEVISLYKKLFPTVHVLKYEELKSEPLSFLNKLDQIIGESRTTEIDFSKRINVSINEPHLFETIVQNRYRAISMKTPYLSRAIKMYCNMTKKHRKAFISNYHERLQELSNHFRENNQKIIKEFPEIGIQDLPEEYNF